MMGMEEETMNLLKVMAALYDSEINCSLSSFWDGGFTVRLGDAVNGFMDSATFMSSAFERDSMWLEQTGWREAAKWLHEAALRYCPNSDYAKTWQDLDLE